jgi:hypothetical protein
MEGEECRDRVGASFWHTCRIRVWGSFGGPAEGHRPAHLKELHAVAAPHVAAINQLLVWRRQRGWVPMRQRQRAVLPMRGSEASQQDDEQRRCRGRPSYVSPSEAAHVEDLVPLRTRRTGRASPPGRAACRRGTLALRVLVLGACEGAFLL